MWISRGKLNNHQFWWCLVQQRPSFGPFLRLRPSPISLQGGKCTKPGARSQKLSSKMTGAMGFRMYFWVLPISEYNNLVKVLQSDFFLIDCEQFMLRKHLEKFKISPNWTCENKKSPFEFVWKFGMLDVYTYHMYLYIYTSLMTIFFFGKLTITH